MPFSQIIKEIVPRFLEEAQGRAAGSVVTSKDANQHPDTTYYFHAYHFRLFVSVVLLFLMRRTVLAVE
jgi:hypothetical protein